MKRYIESNPPIGLMDYLMSPFKKGSNFHDVILTSRGRDAIQLACEYLNVNPDDLVLMPAYTCNTVTSVFQANCKLAFYDISEDFRISKTEIENYLSNYPNIKILYVIHYFGFLHKNLDELFLLCKKKGVKLIEDHAHSALSHSKINSSDVQIFSFRKLFPTADGGGLRITRGKVNHFFSIKSKLTGNLKGLIIALKRVGSLRSSVFRKYIGNIIQEDISSLTEGKAVINPSPISIFGKGIIRSSDAKKYEHLRREQYLIWKLLMNETPFNAILPELDENTVPFGFPIKVKNNKEIIEHFKKYNIFLKIHWSEMPQHARASCPTSIKIASSSITLPIYPGLKKDDMKFIRDELLRCAVTYN